MNFKPNDKLENGRYVVLKKIGTGGLSVVYLCRDRKRNFAVAIKVLSDDLNLEAFKQEVQLVSQLHHPCIITIRDIGDEKFKEKTCHYIVMEYIQGGNLIGRMRSGPLSSRLSMKWMKQLASAVNYAHEQGVVHHDLAPGNILVTNNDDIKISDFGLAKLVGRASKETTKLMGTPAYMSAELCRGEVQDIRSDIYSAGIIFFEMLTGQTPFKGSNMAEVAMQHIKAPIPSAREINPEVSEVIDKMVSRMIAKDPNERYQSMSEVLEILEKLV